MAGMIAAEITTIIMAETITAGTRAMVVIIPIPAMEITTATETAAKTIMTIIKAAAIGYSPASYSWSSGGKDPHGDDSYGDDKDKGGKGNVPPPECAPADPGHGKYGNWNDGKGGDGDNGKFGRHYVNYYKDLCDKDKHDRNPGHHRDCDPGSPAPLPGSLPLFVAGLIVLGLRKKFLPKP
jgi:hypothetical protein